jgi:hypothetical protein
MGLIESAAQSRPLIAVDDVPVPSPRRKAPLHDEGAPVSVPRADIPAAAPMQKQARFRAAKVRLSNFGNTVAKALPALADPPALQAGAEPPIELGSTAMHEALRDAVVAAAAEGGAGSVAFAETRSRVQPVQHRAGQPRTPRWMTAGTERRGRLK